VPPLRCGNTNTSTNLYHFNGPNLQLAPNRMDFITLVGGGLYSCRIQLTRSAWKRLVCDPTNP
jgi:hypothetical protein